MLVVLNYYYIVPVAQYPRCPKYRQLKGGSAETASDDGALAISPDGARRPRKWTMLTSHEMRHEIHRPGFDLGL